VGAGRVDKITLKCKAQLNLNLHRVCVSMNWKTKTRLSPRIQMRKAEKINLYDESRY
jgi:hypothetical protein